MISALPPHVKQRRSAFSGFGPLVRLDLKVRFNFNGDNKLHAPIHCAEPIGPVYFPSSDGGRRPIGRHRLKSRARPGPAAAYAVAP